MQLELAKARPFWFARNDVIFKFGFSPYWIKTKFLNTFLMNCKFPRFCCGALKLMFLSVQWFPWAAASSFQSSTCWNRPANSWWAARGSFQGPDSSHTWRCTLPNIRQPLPPFCSSGLTFRLKQESESHRNLVDLCVCFFYKSLFPWEKKMQPGLIIHFRKREE